MKNLKIYGYSDDIIEVEGVIEEEFPAYGEVNYVAISDGTLLALVFGYGWTIRVVHKGTGNVRIEQAEGFDGDDIAWIDIDTPDNVWVMAGEVAAHGG